MSSKIYFAAALALAAVPCFASTIAVTNFSFETLPGALSACPGTGCGYSIAQIPGWTYTGVGGQFQPGTTPNTYFNTLSDGPTSAFLDSGVIWQTVGTVGVGTVYTLLVDIGWRLDTPALGSVDLKIGSNTYGASAVGTPVRGAFNLYSVTYTGLATDVGQSIT